MSAVISNFNTAGYSTNHQIPPTWTRDRIPYLYSWFWTERRQMGGGEGAVYANDIKMESTRSSSSRWQTPYTKIIDIVFVNFWVIVLNNFSNLINRFSQHQISKQRLKILGNTRVNFTCVCMISVSERYSEVLMGNYFWCYVRHWTIYILSFIKM